MKRGYLTWNCEDTKAQLRTPIDPDSPDDVLRAAADIRHILRQRMLFGKQAK